MASCRTQESKKKAICAIRLTSVQQVPAYMKLKFQIRPSGCLCVRTYFKIRLADCLLRNGWFIRHGEVELSQEMTMDEQNYHEIFIISTMEC